MGVHGPARIYLNLRRWILPEPCERLLTNVANAILRLICGVSVAALEPLANDQGPISAGGPHGHLDHPEFRWWQAERLLSHADLVLTEGQTSIVA